MTLARVEIVEILQAEFNMEHQIDQTIQSDSKLRDFVERANDLLASIVGNSYGKITAHWYVRPETNHSIVGLTLAYQDRVTININSRDFTLADFSDLEQLRQALSDLWLGLLQTQLHAIVGDLQVMMNEEISS